MWQQCLLLLSSLAQSFPNPPTYSHLLATSVVPLVRTFAPASAAASAAIFSWTPNEIFRSSFSGMAMGSSSTVSLLRLNDMRDNKGARQQKKWKRRGIGSGKRKTAGREHKGLKVWATMKFSFEGGQPPLHRRLPRRGFKNPSSCTFQLINVGEIDSSELIMMKTLKDTSAIGKQIKDGVRLMARGSEHIKWPIHLEVSRVTACAKAAMEAVGGFVRKVYYNKLGFKALLKPEWFEKKGRLLPRPTKPTPKQRDRVDSIGCLPAPTKPMPFTDEEKQAAAAKVAA